MNFGWIKVFLRSFIYTPPTFEAAPALSLFLIFHRSAIFCSNWGEGIIIQGKSHKLGNYFINLVHKYFPAHTNLI